MTTHSDTICALATPPGGAIGIIRLSGPDTLPILSHIFSRNLASAPGHTIHYGTIQSDDSVIDEVLVSLFRAPHSYTGEDAAEISCHGSRYILHTILNLLIQHGARTAHPGEYTQRAFLNGKLDLSQAEAVADLIASTSRASHHIALSQLRGHFSTRLSQLRDQLLHLTTLLELELDFSDHEELQFADRTSLLTLARDIDSHITHLAHSFKTGQAIKAGIPVAIVGRTNAGKSTLLNQLLGEERAIVSDIHGTTRDTVEDCIDINGVMFRFIDTAGLRLTTDAIEQIGIQRTLQAIQRATIILWLLDATPSQEETDTILSHLDTTKTLIIVRNKLDLTPHTTSSPSAPSLIIPSSPHSSAPTIDISAKFGTHIPELKQLIYDSANIPEINDSDTIISTARHYDALMQAHANLSMVINSLETNVSSDLISEDLRIVIDNLSEITDPITPQDTLNNIFSHFCIGK